jgi:hypothetical protein
MNASLPQRTGKRILKQRDSTKDACPHQPSVPTRTRESRAEAVSGLNPTLPGSHPRALKTLVGVLRARRPSLSRPPPAADESICMRGQRDGDAPQGDGRICFAAKGGYGTFTTRVCRRAAHGERRAARVDDRA